MRLFRWGLHLHAARAARLPTPPRAADPTPDSPAARSASAMARATGNEVIGIDLGTTNSCVAVMEGKVGAAAGLRSWNAWPPGWVQGPRALRRACGAQPPRASEAG